MQSPQAIAEKWAQRAGAAGQAYTDGINAVTESPTAKAAARADAYQAGVMRAVATRKFQDGLMRVGVQDWKNAAIQKGAARFTTGVQHAKGKMAAFLNEFLPFLESVKAKLAAMPRGDLEQNLARMMENARAIAQFRRSA